MAKLAEVATHLDLSVARVSQLKSAGIMPDAPRGKHDLDACRKAYIGHLRAIAGGRGSKDGTVDLVAERALLAREQRKKIERENAVAEGEFLPRGEVHIAVTASFSTLHDSRSF